MSSEHSELRRRLELFTDRPTAVIGEEARWQRRERIVEHITDLLEDLPVVSHGRRRAVVWGLSSSVVAVAASVALWLGVGRTSEDTPAPLRLVGTEGPVLCYAGHEWADCADIGPNRGVRTLQEGTGLLETGLGVRLDLGSQATLRVNRSDFDEVPNQVILEEGRLAVVVPPLGSRKQFSVVTPTATVIVHGTVFSVDVKQHPVGRGPTCVRVTEGTVSVRHGGGEDFVHAPGSWGCESKVDVAGASDSESRAAKSEKSAAPRARAKTSSASSLGREARLLQYALGAERNGDLAKAEGTLVKLLGAYPQSVVAPEARASLDRVRRVRARR